MPRVYTRINAETARWNYNTSKRLVRVRGWAKRIKAAARRGKFTDTDRYLAANWPSCALGEAAMYRDIELKYNNSEEIESAFGAEIRHLGTLFSQCCIDNDAREAARARRAILKKLRGREL